MDKPPTYRMLITVIAVLILLIIGGLSLFVLSKKGSNAENSTTQTITAQTSSVSPTLVPSLPPTVMPSESLWYIQLLDDPQLRDLNYYILPSPTAEPGALPFVGNSMPTIAGNVFAPLQSKDYYCTFYKDEREGATLEVNTNNSWTPASICPTQPQHTRASTLFCRPYTTEVGIFTYLYVYKDEQCAITPIEKGEYRLSYEMYTSCSVRNIEPNSKLASNVDPTACREKHTIYSPPFTIQ